MLYFVSCRITLTGFFSFDCFNNNENQKIDRLILRICIKFIQYDTVSLRNTVFMCTEIGSNVLCFSFLFNYLSCYWKLI